MKRRRGLLWTLAVALALCGACGVWLHVQRQQYERNRQLIAALVHNDTKTALALVNAGAAPNTRQFPAPAPSLKSLLEHLLHHMPPPANDTPTAFLLACGALVLPMDGNRLSGPPPEENRPLLQAMLAHGADVHARANGNRTALC
jgi:hypothetical protein